MLKSYWFLSPEFILVKINVAALWIIKITEKLGVYCIGLDCISVESSTGQDSWIF